MDVNTNWLTSSCWLPDGGHFARCTCSRGGGHSCLSRYTSRRMKGDATKGANCIRTKHQVRASTNQRAPNTISPRLDTAKWSETRRLASGEDRKPTEKNGARVLAPRTQEGCARRTESVRLTAPQARGSRHRSSRHRAHYLAPIQLHQREPGGKSKWGKFPN